MPRLLNQRSARTRNPVTDWRFSSGRTSTKASLEASSTATWTNSQPTPSLWQRRSPVIRWPTRRKRASFLVSKWTSSPARARLYRRAGSLGSSCASSAQAQAGEMPGHGAAWQVETPGNLLTGHPVVAAEASDHGEPGRGQPVGDPVWRRAAALQAGNAFAAKAGEPLSHGAGADLERARDGRHAPSSSSTRRTITARPKGVVRAFLWAFIRVGLR
jgi:hypothetical protein